MKCVAHAPNTRRLPPHKRRHTECISIDTDFLCPCRPLPFTQSRQEHVNRARRTRKALFCIYVCAVCRNVEGFQPHEPTKVHALITRKRDIWPHMTPPTQLAHVKSHQSHRTTSDGRRQVPTSASSAAEENETSSTKNSIPCIVNPSVQYTKNQKQTDSNRDTGAGRERKKPICEKWMERTAFAA